MGYKHRPKKAKPSIIDAIDGTEIIKTLRNHIFNHPHKREYVANHMESSQVTAALGLLKKVLPDLQAHKIDVNADVIVTVLKVAEYKPAK